MKNSKQLIAEDNGTSIGFVGNYIDHFKKMTDQKGSTDNSYMYNPSKSRKERVYDLGDIPVKESSEEDKILYFYKKLGNQECTDFNDISLKIATSIKRGYNIDIDTNTIVSILSSNKEKLLSRESDFAKMESVGENAPLKETFVKIKLPENTSYLYIPNKTPLTKEELELVSFVDQSNICFSSKEDSNFYLALKDEKIKSFDNLFNFNKKEKIMLEMYKDTLGDEQKAKKLVLMARMLDNSSEENISKRKSKISKNKKKNNKVC